MSSSELEVLWKEIQDLRARVFHLEALEYPTYMAFVDGVCIADGNAQVPGLRFCSDPDTGFYRYGANQIGILVGGVVAGYWGPGLNIGAGTGATLGDIFAESSTTSKPEWKLTNTNADADSAGLVFVKDSVSPAINDLLGTFSFLGNDSNGNPTRFAFMRGIARVVADGSEQGGLDLYTQDGGAEVLAFNVIGINFNIAGDLTVGGGLSVGGILELGAYSMNGLDLGAPLDDTVVSFTVPSAICAMILIEQGAAGKAYSGLITFRAYTDPFTYIIAAGPNIEVTTGVLTGTTGTDGKVTVSAHTDAKVYVENRSGGQRWFHAVLFS